MSARGTEILVSPIGVIPPTVIEAVRLALHAHFGMPTAVRPLIREISFALDPARDQYHSTPILARLAQAAPPGAIKVVGLTEVDLFIPILTYVYGEAQLDGRACILSTSRLGQGLSLGTADRRYLARVAKEAAHELGHTFNLRHCPDPLCLMHFCRNEADVDHKGERFCRYCSVLLRDALQVL